MPSSNINVLASLNVAAEEDIGFTLFREFHVVEAPYT